MNCIIVADKLNNQLLGEFAGRFSSLNLVGTYNESVLFTSQLAQRQDVDLVFLDIDILEKDILSFLDSLNYQPNIIMLSSDNQNALKAFDLNVVDYLIKPVSFSRFCKAVDKAIRYYSSNKTGNSGDNEIFIKKGSALVKLKFKDIIYIEALENYVLLTTKGDKFTIHFTMKAIENQLPSGIFIRVHRSFIVNMSMIHTINENSLKLTMGKEMIEIAIGKSFREPLLSRITQITL